MNDAYCRDCIISGGNFYINEAGVLVHSCDMCPFFERYPSEQSKMETEEKESA